MKTRMVLIVFALLVLVCQCVSASEMPWIKDLDKALVKAQEVDKPILVDFSGSDWCIWCIRLDKEVFAQVEFIEWAKDKVVPCLLDFPRKDRKDTVSEEQKKKNKEAAEKFGVSGYPTVLLLAPDGTVIARTGYRRGGPKPYIKHLERLILFCKACHSRKKRIEKAQGFAKAKLGASLLKHCPEGAASGLIPIAKAIFEEDEENETGLRPHAAYILVNDETEHAKEAEDYLATTKPPTRKKEKDYYLSLVEGRVTRQFYGIMRKVKVAEKGINDPDVNEEAKKLVTSIEAVIDRAKEKRKAALYLKLAVAQACAPNFKAAKASLVEAKTLGVAEKRLKNYQDYIDGLQP
jgi:protein disulfide-isomerase